MGKVLAMTLRVVAATLLLLAGCAAIPGGALLTASLTGQTAARPAVTPAPDAPEITVLMRQRGVQFRMALIETDGPHRVWAAKDGAQVEQTNGLLTATRGFGGDLMSSDAPSIATLTDAAPAHRRLRYLQNGSGQSQRVEFDCTVTRGAADTSNPGTHLVETCTSDIGTTRNDYWFGSGKNLLKSREWVSPTVGYIEISGG